MTVLDVPRFYDETFCGEPLQRVVVPATLNTLTAIWMLGDGCILFPPLEAHPGPEMQRVVKRIREWTGWSARRLADVVVTSHTTILGIEHGRDLVAARSGDLRRRLIDAYQVVERVAVLAGGDRGAVTRLLETAPHGRRSAVEELQVGEPSRAYVAALDVLRPRKPGLLVGDSPRRIGGSAALHD